MEGQRRGVFAFVLFKPSTVTSRANNGRPTMPTMGLHYAPNLITTRWQRLKASLFPILQVGVAAGFANLIAVHLFSHHQPFFAPMAAVIVLGLTGGDRLRRAVELNIGVSLGVGVGDLFVGHFGTGWWQMPLPPKPPWGRC